MSADYDTKKSQKISLTWVLEGRPGKKEMPLKRLLYPHCFSNCLQFPHICLVYFDWKYCICRKFVIIIPFEYNYVIRLNALSLCEMGDADNWTIGEWEISKYCLLIGIGRMYGGEHWTTVYLLVARSRETTSVERTGEPRAQNHQGKLQWELTISKMRLMIRNTSYLTTWFVQSLLFWENYYLWKYSNFLYVHAYCS